MNGAYTPSVALKESVADHFPTAAGTHRSSAVIMRLVSRRIKPAVKQDKTCGLFGLFLTT